MDENSPVSSRFFCLNSGCRKSYATSQARSKHHSKCAFPRITNKGYEKQMMVKHDA